MEFCAPDLKNARKAELLPSYDTKWEPQYFGEDGMSYEGKLEWNLVSRKPFLDTLHKTTDEQLKVLTDYAEKIGLDGEEVGFRYAYEVLYEIIVSIKNGQGFSCKNSYFERVVDRTDGGNWISIGRQFLSYIVATDSPDNGPSTIVGAVMCR